MLPTYQLKTHFLMCIWAYPALRYYVKYSSQLVWTDLSRQRHSFSLTFDFIARTASSNGCGLFQVVEREQFDQAIARTDGSGSFITTNRLATEGKGTTVSFYSLMYSLFEFPLLYIIIMEAWRQGKGRGSYKHMKFNSKWLFSSHHSTLEPDTDPNNLSTFV